MYNNLINRRMLRSNAAFILVSAAIIPACPALAQNNEIIVTARKSSENIQDVPISITAVTGEQFEDAGLLEFADVARLTPNLMITPSAAVGGTFAEVNIRGQSAGFLTINADQAVGIYVNGAPITRGTGLFTNLFDVERVEVLKGPQGTLYGKNTTGGAISIVTKAPEFNEFGGYGEITVGNYDRLDLEGVVNIPLAEDKLAARFGVAKTKRDGFGRARVTGRELADDDELFLRGSLLFEPNDDFSLRINADYHDADEAGSIFRSLQTVAGGFFSIASEDPDIYVGDELGTVPQFAKSEDWNINMNASLDLDSAILDMITSYREQNSSLNYRTAPSTEVFLAQDSYIFAQEIRLSGDGMDDRLKWQAGVFYSYENGQDTDFLPDFGQFEVTEATNEGWSIFTQSSFAVTDRLNLTLGLRYTDENRNVLDLEPGAPILSASASFDAFSWLASIDFKPTDEILLYGSVSKGFRSGSIDQGNLANVVAPEFLYNYEIGFKADLFDNRLRINGAGYYSDYRDIQRVTFDPEVLVPTTVLRNAAKATIWGLELETTAKPLDGLTLGASAGYTNASYDEFTDALFGVTRDRSDEPFGGPSWQLNFSGRYEASLNESTNLGIQANYFWVSTDDRATDSLLAFITPEQARLDSYGILNAQIDLDIDAYGGLNIALFGTNLTDNDYYTGAFIASIGSGLVFSNRITGSPRTWGLRLTKSF